MRVKPLQNNLTAGELSPEMRGRFDLPVYFAGAKSLANMITMPQGGATRAPGTVYVDAIPDVDEPYWLVSFEFSPTQSYVLAFTHLQVDIWRAFGHINGGDEHEQTLVVPWTRAQIPQLNFAHSADTLLVFHPDVEPQRILRDTTEALGDQFGIDDVPLTNIPFHAFNDAASPTEVDEIQRITLGGTWSQDQAFRLRLGALTTQLIFYGDPTKFSNRAGRIKGALEALATVSPDRVTVSHAGTDVFDVSFINENGDKDWPEMVFEPAGDHDGTGAVTTIVDGDSGEEPVWSAARGWAKMGVFLDSRLVLGASKSRVGTIWASKVGDFFNFDVGDAQDDDAIDHTPGAITEIRHIVAGRNLEIYTTEGVQFVTEAPMTPTNFALEKPSDVGVSDVRPARIDGATLFVDREGRGLHEFLFGSLEENYSSEEVSLLAQHLVKDPIDMAVVQAALGDYAYLVNGDGSLAILNRKRAQDVFGMTPRKTQGTFERVVEANRKMYIGVRRTIDGTPVRYLERFDDDALLDAQAKVAGVGLETWAGFDHLESESVEVIADGNPEGTQEVVGGEVTTEVPASIVEAGLGFEPECIPMPLTVQLPQGPVALRPRRIVRTTLMLQNSGDVFVNGYRVADRFLGSQSDSQPPPLLDGSYDVRLLGYSRRPEIKITQKRPRPLTILAIGYELEAT